jgi:hypothetical protein
MSHLIDEVFYYNETAYQQYSKDHDHEIKILVYECPDGRPKQVNQGGYHKEARSSPEYRCQYEHREIYFEGAGGDSE